MIEKFGFKTRYHFKQAQIEVNVLSRDTIEKEIKEKIIPAILELEHRNLINGFYFILHAKIDLILSCDSWEQKEPSIRGILRNKGISDELIEHGGLQDDDFNNLDNNNLELNSRLMMAYLLLKEKTTTEEHSKFLEKIPGQWIHYMYNQFGYGNFYEAGHSFNSGFFQLSEALKRNQCDASNCLDVLQSVKNNAEKCIEQLKRNQKKDLTDQH